jgi:RNA-directed DNA polymerase
MSMKAEDSRKANARPEEAVRNTAGAGLCAEAGPTTRLRTKAEWEQESGLMEAVCERGNLTLAYQRVVENKGAAGVDGIGIAEFKDHLKQHWPTIKAKVLAGQYMPAPVRRVDIPKPQGGVRTLGIPTVDS